MKYSTISDYTKKELWTEYNKYRNQYEEIVRKYMPLIGALEDIMCRVADEALQNNRSDQS